MKLPKYYRFLVRYSRDLKTCGFEPSTIRYLLEKNRNSNRDSLVNVLSPIILPVFVGLVTSRFSRVAEYSFYSSIVSFVPLVSIFAHNHSTRFWLEAKTVYNPHYVHEVALEQRRVLKDKNYIPTLTLEDL